MANFYENEQYRFIQIADEEQSGLRLVKESAKTGALAFLPRPFSSGVLECTGKPDLCLPNS